MRGSGETGTSTRSGRGIRRPTPTSSESGRRIPSTVVIGPDRAEGVDDKPDDRVPKEYRSTKEEVVSSPPGFLPDVTHEVQVDPSPPSATSRSDPAPDLSSRPSPGHRSPDPHVWTEHPPPPAPIPVPESVRSSLLPSVTENPSKVLSVIHPSLCPTPRELGRPPRTGELQTLSRDPTRPVGDSKDVEERDEPRRVPGDRG